MFGKISIFISFVLFGGACFFYGRYVESKLNDARWEQRRRRKRELLHQMHKDYMARAERLRDGLNNGTVRIDR